MKTALGQLPRLRDAVSYRQHEPVGRHVKDKPAPRGSSLLTQPDSQLGPTLIAHIVADSLPALVFAIARGDLVADDLNDHRMNRGFELAA
jgi:hypothetical protein